MKQSLALQTVKERFKTIALAETLKPAGNHNPVMTERFGADPYALVVDDRVYLYMTGDIIETTPDGGPKPNSYQKINTICVISSDDLVNWTDHGSVLAAGEEGAAKWGGNSWAPAAAMKVIDGKRKFFLYFANSGNGIGVLSADSPTGPFTDPIGKALISRATPNCATVTWLFDPAVLVDDDGNGYLYVGGGVPGGPFPSADQIEHPYTARMVKLGDDMISLDGDPISLDPPFLFEDSGINRIGDTYYYSYCSNFNVDGHKNAGKYNVENGQICYMTSKNPLGPYTYQAAILKNPGTYFGPGGNNHHCIFRFNGQHYITYHSQILDAPLKTGGGYRCTHVDVLPVNADGSISMATGTLSGVAQVKAFDPYREVSGATMSTMGGIKTVPADEITKQFGSGRMNAAVSEGSWIMLAGVDFGSGASKFTASFTGSDEDASVLIRLDGLTDGTDIGCLAPKDGTVSVSLSEEVTGIHDLYFLFDGKGYTFDSWKFGK